jgi:excisionase family DNA binding protein
MSDGIRELRTLEWHTPRELAGRWRVSKSTVIRWLDAGKLLGKRFGHQWRVHETVVQAFERDGLPTPLPAPAKPDMSRWNNVTQYV